MKIIKTNVLILKTNVYIYIIIKTTTKPKEIMKTPERFDRAIKALAQAFFNDTLARYNCGMCAVGNIIAESNNLKVINKKGQYFYNSEVAKWSLIVQCETNTILRTVEAAIIFHNKNWHATKPEVSDIEKGFLMIKNTGYSIDDIYKIEAAFENNTSISHGHYFEKSQDEIMKDQYSGLMAVVEVLCKIEGLESSEYKKAFEYQTI